jgi:hypothetical protein
MNHIDKLIMGPLTDKIVDEFGNTVLFVASAAAHARGPVQDESKLHDAFDEQGMREVEGRAE